MYNKEKRKMLIFILVISIISSLLLILFLVNLIQYNVYLNQINSIINPTSEQLKSLRDARDYAYSWMIRFIGAYALFHYTMVIVVMFIKWKEWWTNKYRLEFCIPLIFVPITFVLSIFLGIGFYKLNRKEDKNVIIDKSNISIYNNFENPAEYISDLKNSEFEDF